MTRLSVSQWSNTKHTNINSFRVIHTGKPTKTAPATKSSTDVVVNETGDKNLVEFEKVVGDEDLGGGLVYADASRWISTYVYVLFLQWLTLGYICLLYSL